MGRGSEDVEQRVLLFPHQGEGAVPLQLRADTVEQPGGGLPADVLEGRHLFRAGRDEVLAAQQSRQGVGPPGQVGGCQYGDAHVLADGARQEAAFHRGGVVQQHHSPYVEFWCVSRPPLLEKAPVGGHLVHGVRGQQAVRAAHAEGVHDVAGLPLLQFDHHETQSAVRTGADDQCVQSAAASWRAVLEIHLQAGEARAHQGLEKRRPALAPAADLCLAGGTEARRRVAGLACLDERGGAGLLREFAHPAGRHTGDGGLGGGLTGRHRRRGCRGAVVRQPVRHVHSPGFRRMPVTPHSTERACSSRMAGGDGTAPPPGPPPHFSRQAVAISSRARLYAVDRWVRVGVSYWAWE